MDKDNNLLFISLLIFALSFFGFFLGYVEIKNYATGNAVSNDSGQVSIEISKVLLYNFTISEINWSSGYVFATSNFATLDTLGNVVNGTWNNVSQGFEVVNIGNVNLTMNLSSGKNAASFIGGANPLYQYNVTNLDSGACNPPTGFNLGEFYNVSNSPSSQEICSSFGVNKNIRIDLKLKIPIDSNQGNLTDSFSVIVSEA